MTIDRVRDAHEQIVRGWQAYEHSVSSGLDIIDFDGATDEPPSHQIPFFTSRPEILDRLLDLRSGLADDDQQFADRLEADIAYLKALLGQNEPLHAYIRRTQGCSANGWPPEYVAMRGALAQAELAQAGIGWDKDARESLRELERPIPAERAGEAIRASADELETLVRSLANADADFKLTIETADIDDYWSYWLDGTSDLVRLRLNKRRFALTEVQAVQFALHEILGHGLQYVNIAKQPNVVWPRLFSVHAPTQVLFEGLAQALPLIVIPEDHAVRRRVRLDHYIQLVRAELHIAINSGASPTVCAAHARERVPFWDDEEIAAALSDRSSNPLLRSYLWSYPAGCDWFVTLFEADRTTGLEVLNAAYRCPLTPNQLDALWPSGPTIGGPGGSVRLRQPALPERP